MPRLSSPRPPVDGARAMAGPLLGWVWSFETIHLVFLRTDHLLVS